MDGRIRLVRSALSQNRSPYSSSSVRTPVLFLGPAFTYWASAADILADLALIILPIRLIRGIKDKRLRWRLIFIFSTSSK
jgi:hypothetical protein